MGCASQKQASLDDTHIEFINTSQPTNDIVSPRDDNIEICSDKPVQQDIDDSSQLKVSQLGFQPKTLPAIPTLKQIDREIKQQQPKKVAIKQLTKPQESSNISYPTGQFINKIKEATDIIEPNSLSFLLKGDLEPEEQAMLAWKIISSNYEQEDPTVTLEMCQQALIGLFGYKYIIENWIFYQKQFFCIDKSKFIRIFIALHLLKNGESLHKLVYTGKSADDDIWSLFQFINCNQLHGVFKEGEKELSFEEYTSAIKCQYQDHDWLLQLFNIKPTNKVQTDSQNLQFILTRIQIIDDLDFLAQIIYQIANAFQDILAFQRYLIQNIFNANLAFVNFIFDKLQPTSPLFYSKLQLFYFNYLEIDQLHFAFENMTQKDLFDALKLPIQPSQSYDVTQMILSQQFTNVANLLNISKFNTKKRRIHNLSAMSKTAQIVNFPAFSFHEFRRLTNPTLLYNFTCCLCSAQELPISQAVNLLESVFGVQNQIRLLSSLISQKTDLVLEVNDFVEIFEVCKNFTDGKPISNMNVIIQSGVVANDVQSALKIAQNEELTFLCDIIQGINFNGQIIVPSKAYIFKGIQSQDQIDDCIEPFFQLLEGNSMKMCEIGVVFKRYFNSNNYIVQKIEQSEISEDRDCLSALFIVSFYKSVGVSPALHALNGDELDAEIACDMLAALGVMIESNAKSIEEFNVDIRNQCEEWVIELFC